MTTFFPTPAFRSAVFGLLILSCPSGWAQSGTIEGTITDGSSPLAGVTVAVGDPMQSWTSLLATTTTDGSGTYSITFEVPAGGSRDVVVEAAGPAHAPARYGWSDPLPCFFNCGPGGEVTVGDGATLTGIDFSLPAGGRISGTITASDTATGLSGATVELFDPGELSAFSPGFNAITASDGSYETSLALPPGNYHVLAAPARDNANYPLFLDNYIAEAWNDRRCEFKACPIRNSDTVAITGGAVTPSIDFALDPGASLSGNLQPDGIQKLIYLYNAAGQLLDFNFVSAADLPATAWSFNGLAGGSYYLQLGPPSGQSTYLRKLHNGLLCPFSGCERARGSALSVPAGASLALPSDTLVEGGQLEGNIIDAATGLAPTGIPSGAALGNYDIVDASGNVVGGGQIVESGGDVLLETSAAVPAGSYYVRTYSEFFGDGIGFVSLGGTDAIDGYADAVYPALSCAGIDCDLASATTVTVTTGSTTSITIGISPGSSISGRVIDAAGSGPIEGAIVRLVDASGEVLANDLTDASGEYRMGGFPAGTYYLRTAMSGHLGPGTAAVQFAYFDKVYGAAGNCSERLCDPTSGTPITLDGSSDVSLADVTVDSGPVISGRILDASSGFVIPRGQVEIYTAGGDLVGRYKLGFFDATYRSTALSPGVYTVVPVVSPAYGTVSIAATGPAPAARAGVPEGRVVEMGTEDVVADLQVVDLALDAIFSDRFADSAP